MNIVKKYINNILRKRAMKIVTGHIGKVEEANDKIICYVDNEKCFEAIIGVKDYE